MYTITKGELWAIRRALEDQDPDDISESIEIVEAILVKNVQITISEDDMYKDPLTEELTEEEQEAIAEAEEEHRVC